MRPPIIPVVLPSLAEALDEYPLVRYVPPRTELEEEPDWQVSDLPDHEVESWNACCGICHEDYVQPGPKDGDALEAEECEALRKLPCEHAYHVRTDVRFYK